MSWLLTSGGQTIGTSASASVLSMNLQGWFPLGLTGLISLLSKGFSKVLSSTTVQKHQFFGAQSSLWSNSHIHTRLLEKNIALTLVSKVMFLHFNMLSRFIIAFLPRSKHLLISSLKSPSAVLLEPKKIKSATVSISPPYICFPSDASLSIQIDIRDVGSIPFHPGKIPWRRKQKPTSVLLPGKSHEQRSLAGYSP